LKHADRNADQTALNRVQMFVAWFT